MARSCTWNGTWHALGTWHGSTWHVVLPRVTSLALTSGQAELITRPRTDLYYKPIANSTACTSAWGRSPGSCSTRLYFASLRTANANSGRCCLGNISLLCGFVQVGPLPLVSAREEDCQALDTIPAVSNYHPIDIEIHRKVASQKKNPWQKNESLYSRSKETCPVPRPPSQNAQTGAELAWSTNLPRTT